MAGLFVTTDSTGRAVLEGDAVKVGRHVYLVENRELRHVPDPFTLEGLGLKWEAVVERDPSLADQLRLGPPFGPILLPGVLIQAYGDETIYLTQSWPMTIRPLADRATLEFFQSRLFSITEVSENTIAQSAEGPRIDLGSFAHHSTKGKPRTANEIEPSILEALNESPTQNAWELVRKLDFGDGGLLDKIIASMVNAQQVVRLERGYQITPTGKSELTSRELRET